MASDSITPPDLDSAHLSLGKARERLAALRQSLEGMTRPGERHDLEVVERAFATSLRRLGDVHAALRQAAREGGEKAWLAGHDRTAERDPLLAYILNAPPTEVEDTLLTWPRDIRTFDMRVVNDRAIRFNDRHALMHYLFRCQNDDELFAKVAAGFMPSIRRLRKSGAELLTRYEELALRPYTTRQGQNVLPPLSHLGRPLAGHAAAALMAALGFFEAEAADLAARLRPAEA